MKKLRCFLALSCLSLTILADNLQLRTAEDRPQDVAAIRAHIDSIFQAYIRKDRDKIRATHARDWRGFLRPSRSIIKGIDAYMQAAEVALSAPFGLAGYEFKEFDVEFHGDMGVVNYVAELVPGRALPFRPMIRVLDLYALDGDHWIQVASHTAPHPETLAARRQHPTALNDRLREEILAAREQVWRAWFENRTELGTVIPPEIVAINADAEAWQDREQVLEAAAGFAAAGGKLLHLEFPHTEIQLYGDVAILYTAYEMRTESAGEITTLSGRGTEIFVRRNGRWVNSGWHLDSGR